jgi:hypothetical protein
MANTVELSQEEKEASKDVQLLTTKPFLYIANTQFDLDKKQFAYDASALGAEAIQIDAKVESELSELDDSDRDEYLKELGLPESGLDKIIKAAYKTLGLITFITAGPKESKAWTINLSAGKLKSNHSVIAIGQKIVDFFKIIFSLIIDSGKTIFQLATNQTSRQNFVGEIKNWFKNIVYSSRNLADRVRHLTPKQSICIRSKSCCKERNRSCRKIAL